MTTLLVLPRCDYQAPAHSSARLPNALTWTDSDGWMDAVEVQVDRNLYDYDAHGEVLSSRGGWILTVIVVGPFVANEYRARDFRWTRPGDIPAAPTLMFPDVRLVATRPSELHSAALQRARAQTNITPSAGDEYAPAWSLREIRAAHPEYRVEHNIARVRGARPNQITFDEIERMRGVEERLSPPDAIDWGPYIAERYSPVREIPWEWGQGTVHPPPMDEVLPQQPETD